MTIGNLIKVVPPPAMPFEAFDGPWEPIEAELGTTLPPDYRDFVRLYGSGSFMECLGVAVPRSQNPYLRLQSYVRAACDALRGDEDCPYPLWPSPGGLLPFGRTDDGDELLWLQRGAPADWVVVFWNRGLLTYETFDCDLTDFLAGLVTGEILPGEFHDEPLPRDRLFKPYSA